MSRPPDSWLPARGAAPLPRIKSERRLLFIFSSVLFTIFGDDDFILQKSLEFIKVKFERVIRKVYF